jgi:hypothetical protein
MTTTSGGNEKHKAHPLKVMSFSTPDDSVCTKASVYSRMSGFYFNTSVSYFDTRVHPLAYNVSIRP